MNPVSIPCFLPSDCFLKADDFLSISEFMAQRELGGGGGGIQTSRLEKHIAKKEGFVDEGSEIFPHLYVFDIFKKVLLGILVQKNLQVREGIVFKLTDHRRQHT